MSGPVEFLAGLQERLGGYIPAWRFIQEALYHPEFGYYSANIRSVGRRGDFSTSPELGGAFGEAVARWALDRRPERGAWHVVEAGAGTGALARSLLKSAGIWGRLRMHYHIVETSPVLRAEQMRCLRAFRVAWHDSMQAALEACRGVASVFSNELVDAFPPRIFELREGSWREVAVRVEGGSVSEILIGEERPKSSAAEIRFADGQRIEIHYSAAEWLASWVPSLIGGSVLVVDYGGSAQEIYRRRPRGTLRAYFHHQRFEGPDVYRRFGKQDITSDVNFDDLAAWGQTLGLRAASLETQSAFLRRHGSKLAAGVDARFLADASGAGEAFKCLEMFRPKGGAR